MIHYNLMVNVWRKKYMHYQISWLIIISLIQLGILCRDFDKMFSN